ncbi:ABC transporter ATP-binding protein [Photobacterium minamisatsumaniensis]|uniref:ABC transporter ATP-binding protein n=1 Tax=Photobacterium minamisatsumaniensis TaxID=2910233 RepID=UPI003D0A382C
MNILTLRNVTKSFDKNQVLKDINLDIQQGEFIVFVGPSGCGKSTLLRLIAGLEPQSSGDMFIDNFLVNDEPPGKRGLAMVFQSYALYPHMTVRENMAFALKTAGQPKEYIQSQVQRSSRILQLDHLLDRKPSQLSGGQRQRVAIGRAIVREPKIFLFDEPLSNLDAELRVDMRVEISALHKKLNSTMIYVTHDQVEAMTLADRIVVLHDGIVEQFGTPLELFNHPYNLFVAGFIGSPKMNFIKGEMSIDGFKNANGDKIANAVVSYAGKQLTMGIRPKDIRLDLNCQPESIKAEIVLVEVLGDETCLHCCLESGEKIIVVQEGQSTQAVGNTVWLSFDSNKIQFFGPDGINLFYATEQSVAIAS